MKILLINPSILGTKVGHYSEAIEKKRGKYPPLGLAYIASSLEKKNHKVKIIDCDANQKNLSNIGSLVAEFDPDVVGVYVMTWTFQQANWIVKEIKKKTKNPKFIMGGPNVSSFPKLSLKYSDFDFAIRGEGEETITELVDAIHNNRPFKEIKGLIFRSGKEITVNPPRPLIENLDELPFPAWHLLPLNNYFDIFTRNKRFATMITSRGCPYRCTFCDRKNRMGKKWRTRSPQNIVKEIKYLKGNYGIKEFMFFDDNFITDKKKAYDLCKLIKEKKLDITWECRARVDCIDKELLKAMKEAGCYRIRYGMEAGDDRILKNLKKDITVRQIRECARMTKEKGIEVFAYFMMGSPGEDCETLKKTLNLALEIDPDFVAFSKTILIIGSKLFEWGIKDEQIKKDYWQRFLLGKEKNPSPSISTKELPAKLVDDYVNYATNYFYTRPHYLFKRIKNIKSITQAYRQFGMGISLLKPKL